MNAFIGNLRHFLWILAPHAANRFPKVLSEMFIVTQTKRQHGHGKSFPFLSSLLCLIGGVFIIRRAQISSAFEKA